MSVLFNVTRLRVLPSASDEAVRRDAAHEVLLVHEGPDVVVEHLEHAAAPGHGPRRELRAEVPAGSTTFTFATFKSGCGRQSGLLLVPQRGPGMPLGALRQWAGASHAGWFCS